MSPDGLVVRLLPVHLKPLPDELLSSWLIRLAHAHGQKTQSFCANVFGRDKSVWNRDIDKLAPTWLLETLSNVTATPIEAVKRTTLRAYAGVLYEHLQPNGNTRWILPLGIYHRTHRHHGLLYCPACLAEDRSPYFRRSWRLAYSTVCTKHKSWLRDSCPKCSSTVVPHRTDMQSKEFFPYTDQLVHCWRCGYDLRNAHPILVSDHSLLWLQRKMDSALRVGYTFWDGNPSMYSLVFFDGVRALITGIVSRQSIERINQFACREDLVSHAWPHAGFEFAKIEERQALMIWLSQVLHKWPSRFQQLIRSAHLRYADLIGDSRSRPLWYERVIWSEASGENALISHDEAAAIVSAVERRDGRFTLAGARRLSGRDLSACERIREPVTDEAYEVLLTGIDHQIAGTLDKTERACLIRDKVMFATARQLGLSEGELSALTLKKIRSLVPEMANPSFCVVAQNPAQARAWVEWYWSRVRPELCPQLLARSVFTSSRTRQSIRPSTISARFQRAVNAALLRTAIPSFGHFASRKAQYSVY